jgi:hypothetical protein
MTDHQMTAERRALLDYISVLLKNPDMDNERILASASGALHGLLGSSNGSTPQPANSTSLQQRTERKPKSRKSPSDGLYVKGKLEPLKNFLGTVEADMTIGLSAAEIRQALFDNGDIGHSITPDHIQRILVANQRHFQRLSNGNWRPMPNMKFGGPLSGQRLIESKKRRKPDTNEHDSQSEE